MVSTVVIVSWCWFDSCLGNGSQASWTGAILLPRVSLHTLGIVASRSQGLTFFEPPDHRRNTPFPALIFKVPEKTSIGQLEVTCQHLNQSLRSLGKIQLNGPAELSPTLLLKSVTGRTEVRVIVTGERPFLCAYTIM